MERAGQSDRGSITGIYTVLMEGDDVNEPVADEVRSILDGHIVLSREIAATNQYPAIDILASLSRIMDGIVSSEHKSAAGRLRGLLAKYKEIEFLVQMGEYQQGMDQESDDAMDKITAIRAFLQQNMDEYFTFKQTTQLLAQAIK
jgi:type III secretion protein N (ATPase)